MNKPLLTIIAMFFLLRNAQGQSFNKRYPLDSLCTGCSLLEPNKAQPVAGGYSLIHRAKNTLDTAQVFLEILTDEWGNVVAQDTLAYFQQPEAGVLRLDDGDYIFFGIAPSGKPYMAKKTADGTTLWSQEYDIEGVPAITNGTVTAMANENGELFLVGHRLSVVMGSFAEFNLFALKAQADGVKLWDSQRFFSGTIPSQIGIWPASTTDDGGVISHYVLATTTTNISHTVWRLNGSGDFVTNLPIAYNNGFYEIHLSMMDGGNNNTLIAKTMASVDGWPPDAEISLIGPSNNLVWMKTLRALPFMMSGNFPSRTYIDALARAADGGFLLAGHTQYSVPNQFFVMKLSGAGDLVWEKYYGFLAYASHLQELPNGGLLVNGTRTNKPWMMATDSLCNVPCPILQEITRYLCPPECLEFAGETFCYNTRRSWEYATTDGCDSVVILNVEYPNSNPISATICEGETYEWRDSTYSASGTYVDWVTSEAGCDSVYSLQLTVVPPDSTQLYFTLCEGEANPLTGIAYPTAGEYTELLFLQNQHGCDSTVAVNSFVHPNEVGQADHFVPYGYVLDGNILTADTTTITYGLTDFGCVLTVFISWHVAPSATTGLAQLLGLFVSPNPTGGDFTIEMDLPQATELRIEAIDPLGRVAAILTKNTFFQKGKHTFSVDAGQWPNGIYLLHFQADGESYFKKILKN